MHRPGIASVRGDRIVLDGTTVEEVERYHRNTLILALIEANKRVTDLDAKRRRAEEDDRRRLEEHNKIVSDAAARLKFDE
jgi:DNA transposition AAA+ family ATPase